MSNEVTDSISGTEEKKTYFSFVRSVKNGIEYETRMGKAFVRHNGQEIFLELDAIPAHGRVILRISPEEMNGF